jgi:hypothetical protein
MSQKIENKINNLNQIDNWTDRIEEIKNIKELIDDENNKINHILTTLNEITSFDKEYDIDKIIYNFDSYDLNKKIKYYQYINQYIKNVEENLFK